MGVICTQTFDIFGSYCKSERAKSPHSQSGRASPHFTLEWPPSWFVVGTVMLVVWPWVDADRWLMDPWWWRLALREQERFLCLVCSIRCNSPLPGALWQMLLAWGCRSLFPPFLLSRCTVPVLSPLSTQALPPFTAHPGSVALGRGPKDSLDKNGISYKKAATVQVLEIIDTWNSKKQTNKSSSCKSE